MTVFVLKLWRRRAWNRRVAAARAWQDAERAAEVERSAALRRILDQADHGEA